MGHSKHREPDAAPHHHHHFHMCWTQGKPQKLEYLRKAKMWYLQEQCSALDDLIAPRGSMYRKIISKDIGYKRRTAGWTDVDAPETESSQFIRKQCCMATGLSKREIKA